MINKIFEEEELEGVKKLEKGEYDNCTFDNCDFANSDFSNFVFVECIFKECNLSGVKIRNTMFRDVEFVNCKMLGLQFDQCNHFLFSVGFDGCQLDHTSFYQVNLKGIHFRKSSLIDVEFAECNLSKATFDEVELGRANFEETNLEGCDFQTAYSYSIDPGKNKMKNAVFARMGLAGLLEKYNLKVK
jgi:fluoroquinolone resistance protein